jgi:2-C-methyl-D-erythritol 4-phosphate cytidylyltransferase
MKKYVVIVAGGSGSRMNSAIPKQFLLLKGKPVLYYSIAAFLKAYADINLVLVLPEEQLAEGEKIVAAYFPESGIQLTTGGQTRFHSVQNGLRLIENDCIVLVHDAVRCMISTDLIHRCVESVLEHGSAVPVISSKDSVRLLTENGNEAIERDRVKLVQTPQAFNSNIIVPAFKTLFNEKFTDEATVVEAFGQKVQLVQGEDSNIKITMPVDLLIAEKLLDERIL